MSYQIQNFNINNISAYLTGVDYNKNHTSKSPVSCESLNNHLYDFEYQTMKMNSAMNYHIKPNKIQNAFLNRDSGFVYETTLYPFKVNTYTVYGPSKLKATYISANSSTRMYQFLDKDGNVIFNSQLYGTEGKEETVTLNVPSNAVKFQVCYQNSCEVYIYPILENIINNIKSINKIEPYYMFNGFINIDSNVHSQDTSGNYRINAYKVKPYDILNISYVSCNMFTRQYTLKDINGSVVDKGPVGTESSTMFNLSIPENVYSIEITYNPNYDIKIIATSQDFLTELNRLTGIDYITKDIIKPISQEYGFINIDSNVRIILTDGSAYSKQFILTGFEIKEHAVYKLSFVSNNESTRQYVIYDSEYKMLDRGEIGNNSNVSYTIKTPANSVYLYITSKTKDIFVKELSDIQSSSDYIYDIYVPKIIYGVVNDTL